jgi:hypothetical protein
VVIKLFKRGEENRVIEKELNKDVPLYEKNHYPGAVDQVGVVGFHLSRIESRISLKLCIIKQIEMSRHLRCFVSGLYCQ